MKQSVSILLVGMMLAAGSQALIAKTASAEEGFYVELGGDVTAAEAEKEWDELVEKNKKLLGALKFYPKAVIQAGDTVSTRIQAGPIASKEKAQKICARMFKQDVPCFVIEGLSEAPKSMANLSDQAEGNKVKVVQLPWLAASDVPAPIQDIPAAPAADDISVADDSELKDSLPQVADVKVAEAIRVPLTEGQGDDTVHNARVTVKALPNIKPVSAVSNGDRYPDERDDSGKGWLTVGDFLNEDIASSFWGEVRTSVPKQAKKLRVRVLRPLMSDSKSKTTINLGPFSSSADAYKFCREGLQARDRGLSCTFSGNEPGVDAFQQAAASPRSESYIAARKASRHRPVENIVPAPGTLSKQYWIQVFSASSEMEAARGGDELKSKHPELFKGMRASVMPSAKDPSIYVVRLGPIKDNDEAIKRCADMQKQSINCRVILYSTVGR